MATKVIKTRTIVKNGLESDWNKLPGFVPLANEPIFYKPDADHAYVRIKMGDGETPLKDLPFLPLNGIPGFDPGNIVAKKVEHKLTFGAGQVYQYDGSADVTVPVYTGEYEVVIQNGGDAGYQEDDFDDN